MAEGGEIYLTFLGSFLLLFEIFFLKQYVHGVLVACFSETQTLDSIVCKGTSAQADHMDSERFSTPSHAKHCQRNFSDGQHFNICIYKVSYLQAMKSLLRQNYI